MNQTPGETLKVVHAIDAKAHAAASLSTGNIDCKGFRQALLIVNVGVPAASAELDAWVEESVSTTAASFDHVPGSSITQATPTANSNATQVIAIDLLKRKRYLNVHFKTDGSNAVPASADLILFGAKVLPVTPSATVTASI